MSLHQRIEKYTRKKMKWNFQAVELGACVIDHAVVDFIGFICQGYEDFVDTRWMLHVG